MTDGTKLHETARLSQRNAGATAIAVALIGLGLFVLYQGYTMALEQSSYARVGPHIFPYIVGAGLILIGGLLARDALKNGWAAVWAETADEHASSRKAYWRQLSNVILVGAGLVLNALIIAPLGFIVASTLMFALTTRAFGSRRILFDLAIGALFSGFIFVCFTHLLGLPLPGGTVWGAR